MRRDFTAELVPSLSLKAVPSAAPLMVLTCCGSFLVGKVRAGAVDCLDEREVRLPARKSLMVVVLFWKASKRVISRLSNRSSCEGALSKASFVKSWKLEGLCAVVKWIGASRLETYASAR